MITLLVAMTVAGLVTGGVLGRTIGRTKRLMRAAAAAAPAGVGDAARLSLDPRLRGLPCALGDIVLRADGEEAWLAGAVLFRERAADRDVSGDATRTVAALFVAPESGRARAIYARSAPDVSLDWMWPLPAADLTVGDEPPSALEHEEERFERVRRLPLGVETAGEDPPDLGTSALVGEYEGGGGARLIVVIGTTETRVWKGRRLEPGMYEVLPGKKEQGA